MVSLSLWRRYLPRPKFCRRGKIKIFKSNQTRLQPLLYLLGVLIGLIILSKILGLALFLQQPAGIQPLDRFSWDGVSSINLVVVWPKNDRETGQSVVSFNPKDNQITVMDIVGDTYTSLPKSLGSWRLGSVYRLGEDEATGFGGRLLSLSISKLLGLPIDGLVMLPKKPDPPMEEIVRGFRQNRLSIISFVRNVKSDLSPLQLAKVLWALSGVRGDKTLSLNFLTSNITQSKLLPDSSRVLGVDTIRLDLFIRQNLADPNFVQESKNIVILNATSHAGLTVDAARMVTNMGGNVIITANANNPQRASSVVLLSGSSQTARRLMEIFAPACLPGGCKVSDDKVTNSRGQIVVVLGEDYYRKWHGG